MQHQYWVTKKSVQRRLGGKEDECIVSSDAELDAKLELFKSINESCVQLQRVIDLYQERLCFLAQEENALGRYLKEHGKSERNAAAGQLMSVAGKALAYAGHQRLSVRPPLVRLHHEVDTFRGRAVADTRATVAEMEKVRTEYRAALSWMKAASAQLDPDSGHGLDRFRKAQSYVKSAKARFDQLTLACLQKVDLLAAARCNMFSHSLLPYQGAVAVFAAKAADALSLAASRLEEARDEESVALSTPFDPDRSTFFNAEYSDAKDAEERNDGPKVSNLLGEEFVTPDEEASPPVSDPTPGSTLYDLSFLNNDFMPSSLMQEGTFDLNRLDLGKMEENANEVDSGAKRTETTTEKEKTETQMSWLSLFAELDPLANPQQELTTSSDTA